jgi:hypothetical protein
MTPINRPAGCTCSAVAVAPNRAERRQMARARVLAGPVRVHADGCPAGDPDRFGTGSAALRRQW